MISVSWSATRRRLNTFNRPRLQNLLRLQHSIDNLSTIHAQVSCLIGFVNIKTLNLEWTKLSKRQVKQKGKKVRIFTYKFNPI